MITVSVNSIVGNNGHHDNEHNHEAKNSTPATSGPGVFNPAGQAGGVYAPNQKKWEDIIPAFYYSDSGTRTFFAGRNWDADGKAIYYGLGTKNGLCGESGAKEFALDEYNTWREDFPGLNGGRQPNNGEDTSQKRAIINDLKGQGNIKDGDLSKLDTNFDELPAEPKRPKGPNRPDKFTDLITGLDTFNTTSPPPANIRQALAGVVWKDMNNNGVQDAGEEVFGNLGIQIIDPTTNLPLTPAEITALTASASFNSKRQPLFSFAGLAPAKTTFSTAATVVSVTTDANGYFEVPSLPEGDWQVNVITPDGWTYTYDSAGSSDGQMPGTYVPAGGAGFAWAGLVLASAAPSTTAPGTTTPGTTAPGATTGAGTKATLSTTGVDSTWMLISIAALTVVGAGLLVTSYLRPEEEEESEAY
jgi:hypothetical protein